MDEKCRLTRREDLISAKERHWPIPSTIKAISKMETNIGASNGEVDEWEREGRAIERVRDIGKSDCVHPSMGSHDGRRSPSCVSLDEQNLDDALCASKSNGFKVGYTRCPFDRPGLLFAV